MRRLHNLACGLVVLALVVGLDAIGSAATPVFRDGRVLLPVFVAADAVPEERAAAVELARVLGVMSGLAWPVQEEGAVAANGFYVGRTRAATIRDIGLKLAADLFEHKAGESGPDGFKLLVRDGCVFIVGATPEATNSAVAWLLQREAGVRWYAPGEIGEVVPGRSEWSLPDLNVVREPAYLSREIAGLETPDGRLWAMRNGLRSRLEFSHALNRVFPPACFTQHPEWSATMGGQRLRPTSADDHHWQPNLALPEVAEQAARTAAQAFAREPDRISFSLGINDTVRFDQSEATRKLVEPLRYFRGKPDYSPLVFTFMNRVADALPKTSANRYLGCLAYFWCENPPPFPVNRCVVPYVTTDRGQYYDAEYRLADLDLMSRWRASGVTTFGLWEYGYGQGFIVPREPCHAMTDAVREGWRRGARGYMADIGPQRGFDEFKVWILARLLWEPELSYEELADDFARGYYGPAADPMRRFLERCEEQWMTQSGPPFWLKYYQQEDQALLFPPAVCRELRGLLQAATQLAKHDDVVTARIAWTSQAFLVTETYVDFDAARHKLAAMEDSPSLPDGESFVAEDIQAFVEKRHRFVEAFAETHRGKPPATTQAELAYFVSNDPVPRLLWLAGQRDPTAPKRLLEKAGPVVAEQEPWLTLATTLEGAPSVANQTVNASFEKSTNQVQEPHFLYPRSGKLPTAWEVHAMPTENGSVALIDTTGAPPCLRIEGAWDAQVYQWLPATPGLFYVATAKLRGATSPGNDSALFLTFLDAAQNPIGEHRMQSLPKGITHDWRTAVLADRTPVGAVWVGVGIGASRQVSGDWLEIRSIELRGLKSERVP